MSFVSNVSLKVVAKDGQLLYQRLTIFSSARKDCLLSWKGKLGVGVEDLFCFPSKEKELISLIWEPRSLPCAFLYINPSQRLLLHIRFKVQDE